MVDQGCHTPTQIQALQFQLVSTACFQRRTAAYAAALGLIRTYVEQLWYRDFLERPHRVPTTRVVRYASHWYCDVPKGRSRCLM